MNKLMTKDNKPPDLANRVKYDTITREMLKEKILSMSEAQQDALLALAQSIRKRATR